MCWVFLHREISPGCTGLEFKKKGKRTKINVWFSGSTCPMCVFATSSGGLPYLWNYPRPSLKGRSPLWKYYRMEITVNLVFSVGNRTEKRESKDIKDVYFKEPAAVLHSANPTGMKSDCSAWECGEFTRCVLVNSWHIGIICFWLIKKDTFPWYRKCLRLAQKQGFGLISFWWMWVTSFLDFWMQNKEKCVKGACKKSCWEFPQNGVDLRSQFIIILKMTIDITVNQKSWRTDYFCWLPLTPL